MDKDFALNLAAQISIDVQQVIREDAEVFFLNRLFESSISERLVFKGGTALRLLYGSPRFSEDLDFSVTDKIEAGKFKNAINRIVKSDERLAIRDLTSKYYTHLAEIRIKEPWQEMAFSLKIEISRREVKENQVKFANVLVTLSFTYCLGKQGILNQIAYEIEFATTKKTKRLELRNRAIIFRQIAKKLFFGYILKDNIFIAQPEKAFLDTLYIKSKGLTGLNEGELNLKGLSKEKFLAMSKKFPSSVQKQAKRIIRLRRS